MAKRRKPPSGGRTRKPAAGRSSKPKAKPAKQTAVAVGPDAPRFRYRIVDFRRVPASELAADPRNWRRHSDAQRESVASVLQTIGFAGAVVARLDGTQLVIVDGHLRADLDSTADVPVLVVDLDEAEAGQLLATFDPIGAMADVDRDALGRLLDELPADGSLLDPVLLEEIRDWMDVAPAADDRDPSPDGASYGDHDGRMRDPSEYSDEQSGVSPRLWVLEVPRSMLDEHEARVSRLAAELGGRDDGLDRFAVIEAAVDHVEGLDDWMDVAPAADDRDPSPSAGDSD